MYLTQKPIVDAVANSRPAILIRASDGNTGAPKPKSDKTGKVSKNTSSKVKFSTMVSPDDLEAFYTRNAEVCKGGMTGLKKRDRKRKAKGKAGASKGAKA